MIREFVRASAMYCSILNKYLVDMDQYNFSLQSN